MNASFVDTLGEKMLKSILKRRSVLLLNYYTIIRYCYYYMLEVVGTRKNGRARSGRKGERARARETRAPVLSFAHYFQAPATQAR